PRILICIEPAHEHRPVTMQLLSVCARELNDILEPSSTIIPLAHSQISADIPLFYKDVAAGEDHKRPLRVRDYHPGIKQRPLLSAPSACKRKYLQPSRNASELIVDTAPCSTLTTLIRGRRSP